MKDEDDSSDPLERVFMHQSPATGQVSAAKLTLRQLCRLLCPASSSVTSTATAVQVLQVLPDGTYSGWESSQSVPILREALAQWYYEDDGETKGPLTCRQVAEQIVSSSKHESIRFYAAHIGSWKVLAEIPELQVALQAFETLKPNAAGVPVEYDPTAMAFPAASEDDNKNNNNYPPADAAKKEVQDELEAFLASTDKLGNHGSAVDDDDADEEAYESDNGTRYVKDWRTGNFVHEALVAPRPTDNSQANKTGSNIESSSSTFQPNKRSIDTATAPATKKRKKPKFAAKNAKCWVYITGLPHDATEDEVATFCSKVGILDLDPETQRPKVKVYRYKEGAQKGQGKGDGSVCYARPESVELALSVLDEAPFRPERDLKRVVHVQRAKFEQRGDLVDGGRQKVSTAKRKVAQLAVKQAMDWDGGEYNGRLTGGMKGLRIIVLQPLFTRNQVTEEALESLEKKVRSDCETCGDVEKITAFASNPRGVVLVKFTQPTAASEAVKLWDGREFDGRRVQATFWDGVTDYTVRNEAKEEAEMEKRHEEFGQWLESQDLPEELRLQVETAPETS